MFTNTHEMPLLVAAPETKHETQEFAIHSDDDGDEPPALVSESDSDVNMNRQACVSDSDSDAELEMHKTALAQMLASGKFKLEFFLSLIHI